MTKPVTEPTPARESANYGYRIRQLERRPAPVAGSGLPFAAVFSEEIVLTDNTGTCTPCDMTGGFLYTNDTDYFPAVTGDLLELPLPGIYQVVPWVTITKDPTLPDGLHQVTYFPSNTLHYGVSITTLFTTSGQFDGAVSTSYNPQVIWSSYYVGVENPGVSGVGVTHFWINETIDPNVQRGLDVFRIGDFPIHEIEITST